jgi:hypothetical protein
MKAGTALQADKFKIDPDQMIGLPSAYHGLLSEGFLGAGKEKGVAPELAFPSSFQGGRACRHPFVRDKRCRSLDEGNGAAGEDGAHDSAVPLMSKTCLAI